MLGDVGTFIDITGDEPMKVQDATSCRRPSVFTGICHSRVVLNPVIQARAQGGLGGSGRGPKPTDGS